MDFDPTKYGPEVARVLALDGNGSRLLPLRCVPCSNEAARGLLGKTKPKDLFRDSEEPDAAMAGLWLYFSCFEEAHELANSCSSAEGYLWHAILHRLEGDSGNSAYWFKKAHTHPVHEDLSQAAAQILMRHRHAEFRVGRWDPFAFVSFCDRARQQPGSEQEQAALEIQRAEWQILFDYCARPTK
jgi:hypothetical protein